MDSDVESDNSSNQPREYEMLEYVDNWENNVEVEYEEAENIEEPLENTFDLTLPATHSYLGQNLEELRGRILFDDGIYINLPLLVRESVILFPGQTLPMTINDTQTIDMLLKCLQNSRTLGVVCMRHNKMVPIGTTAEIYQCLYKGPEEGYCIKAKGRQRFKILQGYDRVSAIVKVLPEITLGPPLFEVRLASLDRLRMKPTNEEDFKKQERVENIDSMVTPWPGWVYRQYDPLRLSLKIRKHLEFIENRGSSIPEDPTNLSLWVAKNLILDDSEKIALLNYDCAISRLQREIKYLIDDKIFVCSICNIFIGRQSNMFPMSIEGPLGTYCNPSGIIYDTVTLYHAQGLTLSGNAPSMGYTWFPGYGWTIATCSNCHSHMGWKFTAVENNLKPKAFWGLTRKSLKTKEI
ncbi:PREDICTED: protein cereblon isoform X2 [Dufourea novaeangliae]|uniref:protein cereblon isoform X2 n=1 Tax=Dufourea novaeangliae TaxID=178035 RepID=UPI0007676530|nr:PREDICTED: protein cereblon isoform X2 [Dufourea novaeangliae]